MAHIQELSRNQILLLPPVVDDWIPQGHPARVINMFVESLNMEALGIKENNQITGRPSYDPKLLTKIILYGYSNGIFSSRKLERKTYEDLAYIWVTGNLHPDYRTIARFRQKNIKALKNLLKEAIKLYQACNIPFDGVVFSDGTKIYANANDSKVVTKEKLEELENIAESILKQASKIDAKEDELMGKENNYFLNKAALENVKKQIEEYKAAIENHEKISLTDKDARFMRHANGHGKHLSYNAQLSVDKNGIIVEADVVNKVSDDGELLKERVKSAEKNTDSPVDTVVTDAAFYETNAVRSLMAEGKKVIVPSSKSYKKKRGFFDKTKFKYDEILDEYICPTGKKMKFIKEKIKRNKRYLIYAASKKECDECHLKEKCYKGEGRCGRTIMVFKDREFLKKYEEIMEENKFLLKRRKAVIEPVIGFIKSHLGFRRFSLRGLEKVSGEFAIIAVVYNLIKISKWKKAKFI